MIKIEVPNAFFVSNVEEHLEIKDSILGQIKSAGTYSFVNKEQNIYNTDWHLSPNFDRSYWDIFYPYAVKHLEELNNYCEFSSIGIKNYWFQQYVQGGFHDWHIHNECNFSSVYFLDLPETQLSTVFRFNRNDFQIDVREGQIVTFPSHYVHKSKINTTNKIKTVISFNSYIGNYTPTSSSREAT
jgi:hypothetical protein